MSAPDNLIEKQWEESVDNACAAIDAVRDADADVDARCHALQVLVSMCDALKASSVGYSAMSGWTKRHAKLVQP